MVSKSNKRQTFSIGHLTPKSFYKTMTHGLLDPVSGKTQEWIVDCSDNQPAPDLWLENGDVIDVPDKE